MVQLSEEVLLAKKETIAMKRKSPETLRRSSRGSGRAIERSMINVNGSMITNNLSLYSLLVL